MVPEAADGGDSSDSGESSESSTRPISKMRRHQLEAALKEEGFTGEVSQCIVPELREKLKQLQAQQARLRINFADWLECWRPGEWLAGQCPGVAGKRGSVVVRDCGLGGLCQEAGKLDKVDWGNYARRHRTLPASR